jgi:two-component system nitrate/nitrite response regulator NarL
MNQSAPNPVRLLLVDDHPVVREGLRSALAKQPAFEVVGEAASGPEAVERAKALQPDIVVMDLTLPGMSGIEATEILHREVPLARVVVLTVHNSREYVRRLLQAGARGYVLKDASPHEVILALEKASRAEAYLSAQAVAALVDDYRALTASPGGARAMELSGREREVLKLLAEGLTNKEISERLGVSIRTIETHRERLMKKLDIHTVAGLTRFAIANGYARLD